MMRIQRSTIGEVVFTLSGRVNAEQVDELKALLESEAAASRIVLDLRDLTLVDRDAVSFLKNCEGRSIELRNCPAYIREWMTRERPGG
jgi:anti-anti-sigma regulatory factor